METTIKALEARFKAPFLTFWWYGILTLVIWFVEALVWPATNPPHLCYGGNSNDAGTVDGGQLKTVEAVQPKQKKRYLKKEGCRSAELYAISVQLEASGGGAAIVGRPTFNLGQISHQGLWGRTRDEAYSTDA